MRPRLFKKENYVSFNKDTNKSTCLLCKKELCGLIIGNIKRHYEKMHNIKFTRDLPTKATVNINTLQQGGENKIFNLNKNEFLKCCVGLVTERNLPLRLFDDKRYFKRLIQPYEEHYNLDLNSENILDALEFWSLRVKTYIKAKFAQKLLSLKIDVASRSNKTVMGINVQCLVGYKLVIYTIGLLAIKTKDSPQNLKEQILKCLQDFEIDISQIYAITCDSRGRVLKALQLIQDDLENVRNSNVLQLENYDVNENLLKSILSVVISGAHIIELAAKQFFKAIEHDLYECREVVKVIRYGQMENIFLPKLDNVKWRSTFEMVSSLKEFISNSEISYEFHYKMDWMDTFLEIFAIMDEWSKHLEAAQYIAGDFYRDWLVCETKLKHLPSNEYTKHLIQAILDLKQQLLNNDAFNAALYFDPRFNHLDSPYFSEERRKQAVDHIIRIQALENTLAGDNSLLSTDYEIHDNVQETGYIEDPYNILEAEIPLAAKGSTTPQTHLCIRQKLENLSYQQRLPYSSDILDYWKYMQIKVPEIHILMKIILAVPINQTSNKRVHGGLSVMLTKQKSQLSNEVMNNMLLVKINSDILQEVEA